MSPDQQAWANHLALISRLDHKELLRCFPNLPQERHHFWVTVYAACLILTDALPEATCINEVTEWHIIRGKARAILKRHKVRLRRHTKQFHYNGRLYPIPSYLLVAKAPQNNLVPSVPTALPLVPVPAVPAPVSLLPVSPSSPVPQRNVSMSPDQLCQMTIEEIRQALAFKKLTLLEDASPERLSCHLTMRGANYLLSALSPEQLFRAIPDDELPFLLTLRSPSLLFAALSTVQLTMELAIRNPPIVAPNLTDTGELTLVTAREEQAKIRLLKDTSVVADKFCHYCSHAGHDIATCPERNVHLAEAAIPDDVETFSPSPEEENYRVLEE